MVLFQLWVITNKSVGEPGSTPGRGLISKIKKKLILHLHFQNVSEDVY